MSVGSGCVLGEPWLELLAKHRLLLLRDSNLSGARFDCFLNKGQFSTLSPQSAGVFPKIGCESGKFRARG